MIPEAPWAILEIDLDAPCAPLASRADRAAVWAVVRYRGVVLGYLRVLASELPMTAAEVARAAAAAAAPAIAGWLYHGPGYRPAPAVSRRRPPPRPTPDPAVLRGDVFERLDAVLAAHRAAPAPPAASIVICTRHRPQALAECLGSIAAAGAAGREIIVVDNGPDRETEAVARAFPGVRYLPEPRPSLSRARNTGVAAAGGDIVVFVDDDVRPEPGWVDALLPAFADPAVAVACGLVLPAGLETEAQAVFQTHLGFGGMKTAPLQFDAGFIARFRRGVPVWEIGAGANMAVRRAAVLALGGFDQRVGPGAAGGCGDDSEFWHRVLFSGAVARFEPLSVVRHIHRRDWDSLRRQAHGYGNGHVVALFAQFAHDRDRGDLIRALVTLPIHYAYRFLVAPAKRRAGQPDLLLRDLFAGYLAGLSRLGLAFRRSEPGAFAPADRE